MQGVFIGKIDECAFRENIQKIYLNYLKIDSITILEQWLYLLTCYM